MDFNQENKGKIFLFQLGYPYNSPFIQQIIPSVLPRVKARHHPKQGAILVYHKVFNSQTPTPLQSDYICLFDTCKGRLCDILFGSGDA